MKDTAGDSICPTCGHSLENNQMFCHWCLGLPDLTRESLKLPRSTNKCLRCGQDKHWLDDASSPFCRRCFAATVCASCREDVPTFIGFCWACLYQEAPFPPHDVKRLKSSLYLVVHDQLGLAKIGISDGLERRLQDHRRHGWRLFRHRVDDGVPARKLERLIIEYWRHNRWLAQPDDSLEAAGWSGWTETVKLSEAGSPEQIWKYALLLAKALEVAAEEAWRTEGYESEE